MPERIARTDAFKNVEDATGSGPFKFVKEEWVPGNKVVYVKNTDYVPRKEKPSGVAGAKLALVEAGTDADHWFDTDLFGNGDDLSKLFQLFDNHDHGLAELDPHQGHSDKTGIFVTVADD